MKLKKIFSLPLFLGILSMTFSSFLPQSSSFADEGGMPQAVSSDNHNIPVDSSNNGSPEIGHRGWGRWGGWGGWGFRRHGFWGFPRLGLGLGFGFGYLAGRRYYGYPGYYGGLYPGYGYGGFGGYGYPFYGRGYGYGYWGRRHFRHFRHHYRYYSDLGNNETINNNAGQLTEATPAQ